MPPLNRILAGLLCLSLWRKGPLCCAASCSCCNDVESADAARAQRDVARLEERRAKTERRTQRDRLRHERKTSKYERKRARAEKRAEKRRSRRASRHQHGSAGRDAGMDDQAGATAASAPGQPPLPTYGEATGTAARP